MNGRNYIDRGRVRMTYFLYELFLRVFRGRQEMCFLKLAVTVRRNPA